MSPGPSMAEARTARALTEHGTDSPEYRAERFMWQHPAQRLPRELQRELDASVSARQQGRLQAHRRDSRIRGSR